MGAWLWLAASGRLPPGSGGRDLAQEIGGQVLPVEVICQEGHPAAVLMDQSPPQFGASVRDRAEPAVPLRLIEDDLVPGEAAQVVSTGAGHLLVPVRDRPEVTDLGGVRHGHGLDP
jgi:trans-2,3-dihydro-3-hydroxyanthranilate isomerase